MLQVEEISDILLVLDLNFVYVYRNKKLRGG